MRRFPHLLVAGALLLGIAAAPPVAAQACAPLTFSFSPVGQGCTTGGSRTPPGLEARVLPGLRTCVLEFVFAQNGGALPLPPIVPATLFLGPNDPQLPLPFAPGCVLHASPRLVIPMTLDPESFGLQRAGVVVPVVPELVGVVFYAQAIWLPGFGLRLTNGVRTAVS